VDLSFWTQRCKHQRTGAGVEVCDAGVRYDDLLNANPTKRLPCFDSPRFRAEPAFCDKCERYTQQEAEQQEQRMLADLEKLAQHKSPCCGASVTYVERSITRTGYCASCGKMLIHEHF
jgi:hypothetical protein